MSTTEDTSAIDEKKAEESGTSTTSPDFKGFLFNYLSSIIFTIGISIFIIGGLGLYTTKVAQANMLPDDIELAPFTVFDRIVKPISVDMNVMRPSFFSENKDTLSQKAIFNSQEYLDSFNKSFLCSLKKNADPNGGIFANASLYFSFVYDNLVAKNFLAINTIFFYLSYLPESAIMFLYGLFGIFLWIGLYFFNVCISIFYHIINIPQLFRDVKQTEPEGLFSSIFGEKSKVNSSSSKWEATENITFLRFIKFIIFFFLWIPIGLLSSFITPAFFTIYALISPLFASYKLKQTSTKQDKTFNVIDFIKDTFAYKKLFFFILATLSLFSNGIKYLGNNAIIGIIIAVIFAYFMGLYTNEMPEFGADGFSFKIRQNMKPASVDEINLKDPKLVNICQRIPIDDEKLENIIKGIKPRELTISKEVGGDSDAYTGAGLDSDSYTGAGLDSGLNTDAGLDTDADTDTGAGSENKVTSLQNPSVIPPLDTRDTQPIANPMKLSDSELQSPVDTELVSLKNKLDELNTQLQNSYANVSNEKESSDHSELERQLIQQMANLRQQIKDKTLGQNQSGGRKQKYSKYNKRYNIRWT